MAITFSTAPNPHWVVIDDFDKLPVGAVIYTYSSLNKSVFKPAYEDAAGSIPYGQPIFGFANGTFPPIFWKFDSTNPSDTYYIRVYDKENFPGNDANFLWDFDGISGSGSGGGGVVTTISDLQNLVINGQFYNNIGNISNPVPTLVTLAPSNHDGFVGLGTAPLSEPVGPDIIFAKTTQTETDTLSFTDFPLGSNLFNTTPTPKFFVTYTSDNLGSSNYKIIQFPLVKGVQNLSGQTISVQMWNRLNGSSSNIKLSLRQFFGNGNNGPTQDLITDITALDFSNGVGNWTQTKLNSFVVPGVGAATLGNCGNDAVYLQIVFPASEAIDLSFILPAVYLGPTTSTNDFHTQDYVDSIANTPRTGDVRTSLNAFVPYGWVQMNDGTIGNASSNATARKNIDTFPLFDLIWRTFQASQSLAPMLTSAGANTAYGATSVADFAANNQITLTRNLGRVMSGTLPTQTTVAFTTPVANTLTVASTAAFITGAPVTISGSSASTILTNGVTYYVNISSPTTMFIYLTANDAINNTNKITFGINAVTGNVIFPAHALGSFIGNEAYKLLASDLAPHTHPTATGNNFATAAGAGLNFAGVGAGFQSDPTTGFNILAANQNPISLMQPTVYMNCFIKL